MPPVSPPATNTALDVFSGALVVQVIGNSPADEAGLRGSYKPLIIEGHTVLIGGDIIIALDGDAVEDRHGLQSLIGDHSPGEQVTLDILRDGHSITAELVFGERPESLS